MTTTMSDLRKDIVAKILCRVPMTSLRSLRSTCKKWNALSKDQIFGKAATKKPFLGFMMMDSRVCSLRFNLQGIRNDGDSAVDLSIKQVGILDQVEISKVFHCEGLLLCVLKDNSRLLVWNPYMGQTSWIQPRNKFYRLDRYALGYDKKKGIHKILRFIDDYIYDEGEYKVVFEYEIYDFCSDSWRVLDVTPDWDIEFYHRSVSLKGDSYFFAQEKCMLEGDVVDTTETADFLLCFDFTAERFGPRLPLPFHSYYEETVTLSSVRDEQLAVLYQRNWPDHTMEIWVTTKIKPNAVSWTKFLKVDMRPLTGNGFKFILDAGSFFIDEEEKVAVVFDLDGHERTNELRYQTAHIIGQDGYFKSVNIGGAPNLGKPNMLGQIAPDYCVPLVCSSAYVPSLVQLGKRKERD